jgi:hypothetical protein
MTRILAQAVSSPMRSAILAAMVPAMSSSIFSLMYRVTYRAMIRAMCQAMSSDFEFPDNAGFRPVLYAMCKEARVSEYEARTEDYGAGAGFPDSRISDRQRGPPQGVKDGDSLRNRDETRNRAAKES